MVHNKYENYKVNKKWFSNQLGVGYILQCNEGDDYGLIYGFLDHNHHQKGNSTWIYYFIKPLNQSFSKYTPVTYLKSFDINDPFKELYEVKHVISLNEYVIFDFENNAKTPRSQINIEGRFIYLDIWNQMCHGKLFIDYSNISTSIYYPEINEENKTIIYHDYHSNNGFENPNCILSCFAYLDKYRKNSKKYQYETIFSEIEKIKDYVNAYKLDENLSLFYAGEKGRYHSYPGKDDSFFITKYWKSDCKDEYLNQLVNLHEVKDYYNCCGRNEEDYDKIDQEETSKLRNAIKNAYNIDNHFLFLVQNFLADIKAQKDIYTQCRQKMNNFISEKDVKIFEVCYDNKSYLKFVEDFNRGY